MTETQTYVPAVGDRVTFMGCSAIVEEVEPPHLGDLRLIRYDEGQTMPGLRWWEDVERGPGRFWWVSPASLQPLTEGPQEPATAPQDDAEVSTLKAQLSTLQSQISRMQDDVATIGEHLKKTAERHEWCGEYEEHLSRLVADLSEHSAKTLESAASRVQAYKVTHTFSIYVDADSAEQAERIGAERLTEYAYEGTWTVEEAE